MKFHFQVLSSGFVLMNLTSSESVMLRLTRLDSQPLSYKLKGDKLSIILPENKHRLIEFPLAWNVSVNLVNFLKQKINYRVFHLTFQSKIEMFLQKCSLTYLKHRFIIFVNLRITLANYYKNRLISISKLMKHRLFPEIQSFSYIMQI